MVTIGNGNGAGSMTKAELVEEVSRVSDLTKKHSEVIVDTVFKSIIDALHRGEKIELRGFGSFRLRKREPRKGRNPKTGDKVDVPPKKVPYFKPGKELKDLINREAEAAEAADAAADGFRRCQAPLPSSDSVDHLWSPWRLEYVTRRNRAGASSAWAPTRCRPAPRLATRSLVVYHGQLAYVILNLYPYNNGHLMVVPYRHESTLAGLTRDEMNEVGLLTQRLRNRAARGLPAGGDQRRRQSRRAGGRGHRGARARASGAAVERRHELHDRGRGDPGAAGRPPVHGRAPAADLRAPGASNHEDHEVQRLRQDTKCLRCS